MITPKKALSLILKHTSIMGWETVGLSAAVGRVLAKDLKARDSLASFDNSAMDGYAVRAADLKGASKKTPIELSVRATIRAGASKRTALRSGEAARIMTGAPLPPGADSVVMQESTTPGATGRIKFSMGSEVGDYIRFKGDDIKAGQPLLKKGTELRPYEIALLAAQGITDIPVFRRPRVAVLTTGDELTGASKELSYGRIRNSNGPAILAALSRWNIPSVDLGIVKDDPKTISAALRKALSKADVVVTTGGVSVGDFDYIKSLFPQLGVREIFWRVAVKPGKPLLFGIYEKSGTVAKVVFGLPGNPLSVLVCLEEFVRPALDKLAGRAQRRSYYLTGKAANDFPKPKDRQQQLFCRAQKASGGYKLKIIRPQSSAMLAAASQANALAIAPIGVALVKRGDVLSFRWLD